MRVAIHACLCVSRERVMERLSVCGAHSLHHTHHSVSLLHILHLISYLQHNSSDLINKVRVMCVSSECEEYRNIQSKPLATPQPTTYQAHYTHAHTHTRAHTHTHARTSTRTHTHAHAHTHTHAQVHVHAHTHAPHLHQQEQKHTDNGSRTSCPGTAPGTPKRPKSV